MFISASLWIHTADNHDGHDDGRSGSWKESSDASLIFFISLNFILVSLN